MERANFPGNENVGGVYLYPMPLTLGEQVNIVYNGLLSQSGADQVYIHMGYGSQHHWYDTQDIKMKKTGRGWEHLFNVHNASRLNFCFHDSAQNWDNFNSHNWSVEIHTGKSG